MIMVHRVMVPCHGATNPGAFVEAPSSASSVSSQLWIATPSASSSSSGLRQRSRLATLALPEPTQRSIEKAATGTPDATGKPGAIRGAFATLLAALTGRNAAKRKLLKKKPSLTNAYRQRRGMPTSEARRIYREVLRQNTTATLLRVVVPSVMVTILGAVVFPQLWAVCRYVLLYRTTETVATLVELVWTSFVSQWLALFGLLFSILAGSSYASLYAQNEAIYFAFYSEVSEAKALVEQVALVSQGRSIYDMLLQYIEQYVQEDLCGSHEDEDPAEQLAVRPADDPLESILYITSVGVPSCIYDTVRSLRNIRGQRLGAIQRKMPGVQIALLWLLGIGLIAGFPMVVADVPHVGASLALRGMFGLLCGAVTMTLQIVHELWNPTGGAYNVDGVIRAAVHGLLEELKMRRQGKAFSYTSLPPPPNYTKLTEAANAAVRYSGTDTP
eukprot:TRINITY_DN102661_c0_g1_i1.p1 TRINITY_DN102661_c0_g1~~TRINITY_DN102661_c0_g1_i1.p1  ORF type:complete len:455 (-),score=79.13 TRINITY_DN102661_c0_g1_i1:104-1435(-)